MFGKASLIRNVLCAALACAVIIPAAQATMISFSPAEGYVNGDLEGQPGTGDNWSRTLNNTTSFFTVAQGSSDVHTDYLKVNLGSQGSSQDPAIVDYATKRLAPVAGQFVTGFSYYSTLNSDGRTHQSCIALSQDANDEWGAYLGFNKNESSSIAYHDGTQWHTITADVDDREWYNIEISGDVNAGTFNLSIYLEDDRVPGDANSGLLASATNIPFRGTPTTLDRVMLTNDGSMHDNGGYYHFYDELYLNVPEPATLAMLALGSLALIRRRQA